jgi:threonine/homoserine/homoserine lactone efflux protein
MRWCEIFNIFTLSLLLKEGYILKCPPLLKFSTPDEIKNVTRPSMDITYFFKGLIIGLSIAAPVGPIGILCINRTLSFGRMVGFLSGLGAATADALYGCIAAFGLTFISSFLVQQQIWFRLVGGLFLCFLGFRTMLSSTKNNTIVSNPTSMWNAYASTFFLTLTNPLTILAFTAIFSGIGLVSLAGGYASAGITVLGVFLGSACWWFILSSITNLFKNRLTIASLVWVNRISGAIILGFGIVALAGVITLIH